MAIDTHHRVDLEGLTRSQLGEMLDDLRDRGAALVAEMRFRADLLCNLDGSPEARGEAKTLRIMATRYERQERDRITGLATSTRTASA